MHSTKVNYPPFEEGKVAFFNISLLQKTFLLEPVPARLQQHLPSLSLRACHAFLYYPQGSLEIMRYTFVIDGGSFVTHHAEFSMVHQFHTHIPRSVVLAGTAIGYGQILECFSTNGFLQSTR